MKQNWLVNRTAKIAALFFLLIREGLSQATTTPNSDLLLDLTTQNPNNPQSLVPLDPCKSGPCNNGICTPDHENR